MNRRTAVEPRFVAIQPLEPRQMYSGNPGVTNVLITGTAGNDAITVKVNEVGAEKIVKVTQNGSTHTLLSSYFKHINIIDPGGSNTITIEALPKSMDVSIVGGKGYDLLRVPAADKVLGHVKFDGADGSDKLLVQHSDSAAEQQIRLASGAVKWTDHTIDIKRVEYVDVTASRKSDLLRVESVASTQRTTLHAGDGYDRVDVAAGDMETYLRGYLTIDSGKGYDHVSFHDAGGKGDKYNLSGIELSKPGQTMKGIRYSDTERITLATTGRANEIRIPNLQSADVLVKAGGGDDMFVLGNGNIDTFVHTHLVLDGGTGSDEVFLDDSKFTHGRKLYIGDSISHGGGQAVSMKSIDRILADLGTGNDWVDGTQSSRHLRIAGGFGNDTILGGTASDVFFGDEGNDSLRGNAGKDTLVGNDGTDDLNGGDGDDLLKQDHYID